MTHAAPLSVDIAIVGGGMAGTALACALLPGRFRIALIESHSPTGFSASRFFDPRVVALNVASQQFLHELGAWDTIAAHRLSPYDSMQVWDADGTADIAFDAHEIQQPVLGHIVENSLVVHALQQRLQAAATHRVHWLCPETVTSLTNNDNTHEHCTLTLASGQQIQAALVVAADGATSALRDLANITITDRDYGHTAVIATVRTTQPHQRRARQRFLTDGPLAFLPLRDNTGSEYWCSVVWSVPPTQAEALQALDDDAFAAALGAAFEHRLGDVLAVHGRHAFPLRQRHAHSYHRDHVVLVGDAAHTIHPLAGQGVNLGFMDVRVLASELLAAGQRGVAPNDTDVLARYQRRRRGANLGMTATMELFHRLFARTELPVRWLRNTGLRGVNRLGALKRELMRHAMGV